jgi:predicted DNA-binding antitoxin AbrB/MazE fold protein
MAITVQATYENGVLKPAQPVPLKEHAKVEIVIHEVSPGHDDTSGTSSIDARNGSSAKAPFAATSRRGLETDGERNCAGRDGVIKRAFGCRSARPKDKPITLIDGENLVHMFQKHGHDVYIAMLPKGDPRRGLASGVG